MKLTKEKLDKYVSKLYKFSDSRKIENFVEDEFCLDKIDEEDEFYETLDKTSFAITLFADLIDNENSKLKEDEEASIALSNAKINLENELSSVIGDQYEDEDDVETYLDIVPVVWKQLTKMDW